MAECLGLAGVDAADDLAAAQNRDGVAVVRVGRLPLEADNIADLNLTLPILEVAAGVSGCNAKDDPHLDLAGIKKR